VGPLAAITDAGALFSGDPAQPFRADSPLSSSCRELITRWLTADGTGQGVAWHSRFALNEHTLGRFEAKAMAMLNEQMLSVRLRAQGCRLVDVTWASGALAGHESLPGVIPDWRTQLAERPVDAVPIELTGPGVVRDRPGAP
jgi:hypothetical protein